MGLIEQLAVLRAVGINLNDTALQRLLSLNGFNTDAAINYYFEKGAPPPPPAISQANVKSQPLPRAATAVRSVAGVGVGGVGIALKRAGWPAIANTRILTDTIVQTNIQNLQNLPVTSTAPVIIMLDDSSQECDTSGHERGGETKKGGEAMQVVAAPANGMSSMPNSSMLVACLTEPHYLIGRRTAHAYTLSSGYAERCQSLTLILEDKGYQKAARGGSGGGTGTTAKSSAGTGTLKRDKHAGAKLILEARKESDVGTSDTGSFRSRLPNTLCDFILPLMQADLLMVSGHVAYDVGSVTLMQDVPVSLQIFVSVRLLDLTEPGTLENKNSSHLIEAANDLLLWLHEGEAAVAAVRKQRTADADARNRAASANLPTESSAVPEAVLVTDVSNGEKGSMQTNLLKEKDGAASLETQDDEVLEEFEMLVDKSSASSKFELPLAMQPPLLQSWLTMRSYQLQALHWMQGREDHGRMLSMSNPRCEHILPSPTGVDLPHDGILSLYEKEKETYRTKSEEALPTEDDGVWQMVPAVLWGVNEAWSPLTTATLASQYLSSQLKQGKNCRFYWNIYSQKISRNAPPPHQQASGGILADEMGLGKTVMAASLIAADYLLQAQVPAPITVPRKKKSAVQMQEDDDDDVKNTSSESEYDEDSQTAGRRRFVRTRGKVHGQAPSKRKRHSRIIKDADDSEDEDHIKERVEDPLRPLSFRQTWKFTVDGIPPTQSAASFLSNQDGAHSSNATLIVCPMTLMSQWAEEMTTKTQRGALRVVVYYGDKDGGSVVNSTGAASSESSLPAYTISRDPRILRDADVVVTSYGVLVSDCRAWLQQQEANTATKQVHVAESSLSRPGLLKLYWHRVILDEAHVIKNHHTETARACYTLNSRHRWALTGTPLQNTIDDVYSLIRFLGHEPWCEHRFWRKVVTDPYKAGDPAGMARLHLLLSDLLLRRTKTSKDSSGQHIVFLPPRLVHITPVILEDEEREFYQAIVDKSKSVFHRFEGRAFSLSDSSSSMVLTSSAQVATDACTPAAAFTPFLLKNKYAALFTLLMRIRQACDHPTLVFGKGDHATEDATTTTSVPTGGVTLQQKAGGAEALDAYDGLFGQVFLDELFKKMDNARQQRMLMRTGVVSIDASAPSSKNKRNLSGDEDAPVDTYIMGLMQRLQGTSQEHVFECPICLDDVRTVEGALTRCGHLLCVVCAQKIWPASQLVATPTQGKKTSLRLSAHPASLKSQRAEQEASAKCPMCSDMVPSSCVYALSPLKDNLAREQPQNEIVEIVNENSDNFVKGDGDKQIAITNGTKLSDINTDWRHWGDARRGVSSAVQLEAYITSSKLDAVLAKLHFILDERREDAAWSATAEDVILEPNESICARCGVHDGGSRISSVRSNQNLNNVCRVSNSSSNSGSSSSSGFNSEHVFTGAYTFRCMKCPKQRYCDECFGPHRCISSTLPTGDENEDIIELDEDKDEEMPVFSAHIDSQTASKAPTKVVVFSQWTTMLDIIESVLKAHKLKFCRLDGKMVQSQRAKSVSAFNTDPKVRIMLASLKAGGVGLNLISANHVILVDPWWNPSTEDQAIDRVHRLGQTRPVHVFRFVCHETVEERLIQLQQKKRNMSTQALSGGAGEKKDSSKLTMEELRAFFM